MGLLHFISAKCTSNLVAYLSTSIITSFPFSQLAPALCTSYPEWPRTPAGHVHLEVHAP